MDTYQAVLKFFESSKEPVNAGAVAEATGIDRKEVYDGPKNLTGSRRV